MARCLKCNSRIGITDARFEILEGKLCSSCGRKLHMQSSFDYSKCRLNDLINGDVDTGTSPTFQPDNKIHLNPLKLGIAIDNTNQMFCICKDVFPFNHLVDYELLENGTTVTAKGGTGRAVAGGLLFGGVGAIVGASTAKRKQNDICNSMRIRVTVKGETNPYYIDLITSPTQKDSSLYSGACDCAQKCISALALIAAANAEKAQTESVPAFSPADEIRKYKALLDDGIITQEVFDAKKKQLLGI